MSALPSKPFERPSLTRTGPKRGASHFYRSAADGGDAVAGLPLDSVESTVVAAVRLGYKTAAAQIDRTERIGRRLRQAGDSAAGEGSDKKAMDATEQLVFNALMAGLSWVEGFGAEGGNPLKRLITAQYRILGALLGLTPSDQPPRPTTAGSSDASAQNTPGDPGPARYSSSRQSRRSSRQLKIVHTSSTRRAVLVSKWEIEGNIPAGSYAFDFYSVRSLRRRIAAEFIVRSRGPATLALAIPENAAAGRWKGAICDADGVQVGYVEIEL